MSKSRVVDSVWLGALLLSGQALATELPVAYRCSGNEPFWSLEIEGPEATFTAMGEAPQALAGSFRTLDYAGLFVYRGAGPKGDVVAFVLQQACTDTMAEESEGGGTMPFSAGVSLPDGSARIGCCRALATAEAPIAEDPPGSSGSGTGG